MAAGQSERWPILGVLFVARMAMAVQFQTVGSTAPFLHERFAIDFTQVGTLIGLYMLPGIFIALPGGMLGQRFGTKWVTLAGLLMMAVGGALTGVASSFATLMAGRLISGVGAVLINVLLTKMVADWFAGREIVTAMAIFIASWPLGLALGLMLYTPLAQAFSWSAVMQVAALFSLVSGVLLALSYRDPPGLTETASAKLRLDLGAREWLAVSCAGFVWMIYNVGYIVLISFLPGFFGAHGLSSAQAASVVSFLGWTLIPSVPLAGYLAERLGRPNLFLVGGFVVSGLAAAALPFTSAPLYVFALLALAIGAPAGPIMALPAQALRPEHRAGGMGVYFTWYYAGMALLPGLAGLARDVTASTAAPALFAAAMMALALLGLAGFRLVQQQA
jgi:predicted MFS family arabinose efflux permease